MGGSTQVNQGREGPSEPVHHSSACSHGVQGSSSGVGALQEDRKERTIGRRERKTQKRKKGHKAGNKAQDDGKRATCLSLHLSPRVTHYCPASNGIGPSTLLLPVLLLSHVCVGKSLSTSFLPAGLEEGGDCAGTPEPWCTPTGLISF